LDDDVVLRDLRVGHIRKLEPSTPAARSREMIARIVVMARACEQRVAQGIAGQDLSRLEHGDHVDARSADAHREEATPAVGIQILI